MLVYEDLLTGYELLSDSFPYKEIQNGILWEVEGKWVVQRAVDVNIGGNLSTDEGDGVDDQAVKVVDIVDAFRLQFPVGRIHRLLKSRAMAHGRVGATAAVYAAAISLQKCWNWQARI